MLSLQLLSEKQEYISELEKKLVLEPNGNEENQSCSVNVPKAKSFKDALIQGNKSLHAEKDEATRVKAQKSKTTVSYPSVQ